MHAYWITFYPILHGTPGQIATEAKEINDVVKRLWSGTVTVYKTEAEAIEAAKEFVRLAERVITVDGIVAGVINVVSIVEAKAVFTKVVCSEVG